MNDDAVKDGLILEEWFGVPVREVRFFRAWVQCRRCKEVVEIGYQKPVARIVPSDFEAAVMMHKEACRAAQKP